MSKILVLLDVDQTIIDKNYSLTVPLEKFRESVTCAQSEGVVIGLNSDSALSTLSSRMASYGLHGPVIAEKGALLLHRAGLVEPLYLDEKLKQYELFRNAIVQEILQRNSESCQYLLVAGDVNGLVNQLPNLPPASNSAEFAIIVNGLRKCSLGLWSRRRKMDGTWVIDSTALDDMISHIERIGIRFSDIWGTRDIDRNEQYGIYIAHDKSTNKARAVDHLIRDEVFDQIFMVGDSMSDWLDDPRVTQCAVENASDEYKKKCSMVALSPRTAGVIELLDLITK